VLAVILISALISCIAGLFLVRFGLRARDYALDAPQRFHAGDISRLGGVGMLIGVIAAVLFASTAQRMNWTFGLTMRSSWALTVLVCVAPVWLAGLAEDWTHRLGVRWRFVGALLTAVLATFWLDVRVDRLDVQWMDILLQMSWVSVAFTIVAIAGLPNAMNIIDGYNGLAGMVAILMSGAIAYVALQVGDRELAAVAFALLGATLGFLFWNYPRGALFAGDCGAYLWGAMLAILSIELVQRHDQVSPWFPMLLFAYPVSETLFSVYRKWVRGHPASMADSLHLHQLVYKRIVRGVFHNDEMRQLLIRNNKTSPYMWAVCGLTVAPAILFWYQTTVLIAFCLLFVASYVAAYIMIVRFKVPRWMRSRY
jgi:UDP-GlcNAc:undecaprenyl-phosphate/decaprenyl-phosphate GlcNAc-1-phosphate transferase